MTRYLIKQTLASILKLFLFLTLMFFFIQVMMPGDFVDQFSLGCDERCREELRINLGLNLPIGQRYLQWLGRMVKFDLGSSMYGAPVIEILKEVVPPTLLVFFTGTAIAFLFGLWLGKVTAWRGTGFLSRITTLGGITLFTSFPPWLAWLVTYVLARKADFVIMGEVGGLRGVSFQGLETQLWINTELQPSLITLRMFEALLGSTIVFLLFNWLFKRIFNRGIPTIILLVLIAAGGLGGIYALNIQPLVFDILKHTWIPILVYTLLSFGETMIIMQSSMTEVLKEEYVRAAEAKGLKPSTVREKHAARNAILPVLSRLVISLPYLITGVVIVESSVGWPGMGTNMWNTLYWQNMPVVMGTLMIVGFISLVARLLLDVLTAYFDPRIRYGEAKPITI